MFLARNLNPVLRVDTSRTGAIDRSTPSACSASRYSQQVWVIENTGESTTTR